MTTVILAVVWLEVTKQKKKTMREEELTLQHLSRRAASFRLHLICEFGQLPEQVQAEYTPLTYSQGPRHKQVFHPERGSPLNMSESYSVGVSQNLQLEGVFLIICQLRLTEGDTVIKHILCLC